MNSVRLLGLLFLLASLVACGGGSPFDEAFGDGSANASLQDLLLSAGTLTPAFEVDTTEYSVDLRGLGSEVLITPFAAHSKAMVTIEGMAVPPGTSVDVPLTQFETSATISVMAADGTVKDYRVTFRRDPTDASLSALVASAGVLTPAFNPGTKMYTLDVGLLVSDISTSPTAADAGATITVNGAAVTSGTASDAIALAVGPTPLMVVVTAADGVTQETYTVVVTRAASAIQEGGLIKASNTERGDQIGGTVSISGDTLVVGAFYEDSSASGGESDNSVNGAGAAYVFTRTGGVWSQEQILKASNAEETDGFGASVSISGDTIIVGAIFEDSSASGGESDNSVNGAGAAYVFTRTGGVWSQEQILKASNAEELDRFGESVSISGDTIIVGATSEDSSAGGGEGDNSAQGAGAAYVFRRTGIVWSQQQMLKASNTQAGDQFGVSVAVDGGTLVVGARHEEGSANGGESDNSEDSAGAAYVFTRTGTVWSQQQMLKASNAGFRDIFGTSVSISGDTVVVGAPGESSSAVGGEGDNSENFAGAVYVFTRMGSVWSQQQMLKASNPDAVDQFGYALSVSGDILAVAATFEDSSVSGGESNNSARDAGAVYLFTRAADGLWRQQQMLKASNAETFDRFGWSVSVSGDTVVVGAISEDSSASGGESDNSATDAGAAYVIR